MEVSTRQIIAERALHRFPSGAWVAWAVGRLVAGDDTPSLRVLAGESAPFDAFEMDALVDRCLRELGVSTLDYDTAVLGYAAELVEKLADSGLTEPGVLGALRDMYLEGKRLDSLQRFYLLAYAQEDLRAATFQYYWPTATRDNLDSIVRSQAADWLAQWVRAGAA